MCFTLGWLQQILVLGILLCAIIAILKIIVPYALRKMGAEIGEGAAVIIQCFKIALWAVIAIIVVIIVFQLISCLWAWGGGSLSILPHTR